MSHLRLTSLCAIALVLAISPSRTAARRLHRLVVVGDSLLAGFGSGGLVARGRPGQVDSAAKMVARRAHVRLPLPLMDSPGVPPQLRIFDDDHNGRLDAGEVRRPAGKAIGFRQDTDSRAQNLAVPGEDVTSVLDGIAPDDIARELVSNDVNGRDVLKFLILGVPIETSSVSQVSRARELTPSFILVWLGGNDVLDMATRTDPGAATLSADEFGQRYRRFLRELARTHADMAVANLPDVTAIAALRRAGGDVTSCRTPSGGTEPVAADDLLSIDLDPGLLPTPPCAKVLNAAERAQVHDTVAAFNAQIAGAVAETEVATGVRIALVDVFGLFGDLVAQGVDLNGDGTPDLTTHYLGGIFSLDGIHPTRTGNALIANAFIDAIDARFGETIPRVDVARVAARDPLTRSRFRPAGEPPFGLIGSGSSDDVEAFFTNAFARVSSSARQIRRDLEHELGGFVNFF